MLFRVRGLATAVTGVSLGTIWFHVDNNCNHNQNNVDNNCNHNQENVDNCNNNQKNVATRHLHRFPLTLRAAEEKKKLPRVYFIIRFVLTHPSIKAFSVTNQHMKKAIVFL